MGFFSLSSKKKKSTNEVNTKNLPSNNSSKPQNGRSVSSLMSDHSSGTSAALSSGAATPAAARTSPVLAPVSSKPPLTSADSSSSNEHSRRPSNTTTTTPPSTVPRSASSASLNFGTASLPSRLKHKASSTTIGSTRSTSSRGAFEAPKLANLPGARMARARSYHAPGTAPSILNPQFRYSLAYGTSSSGSSLHIPQATRSNDLVQRTHSSPNVSQADASSSHYYGTLPPSPSPTSLTHSNPPPNTNAPPTDEEFRKYTREFDIAIAQAHSLARQYHHLPTQKRDPEGYERVGKSFAIAANVSRIHHSYRCKLVRDMEVPVEEEQEQEHKDVEAEWLERERHRVAAKRATEGWEYASMLAEAWGCESEKEPLEPEPWSNRGSSFFPPGFYAVPPPPAAAAAVGSSSSPSSLAVPGSSSNGRMHSRGGWMEGNGSTRSRSSSLKSSPSASPKRVSIILPTSNSSSSIPSVTLPGGGGSSNVFMPSPLHVLAGAQLESEPIVIDDDKIRHSTSSSTTTSTSTSASTSESTNSTYKPDVIGTGTSSTRRSRTLSIDTKKSSRRLSKLLKPSAAVAVTPSSTPAVTTTTNTTATATVTSASSSPSKLAKKSEESVKVREFGSVRRGFFVWGGNNNNRSNEKMVSVV